MLTCIPQSIFSWNFRVLGASSGAASLSFNFFTEQGTISLGGRVYSIRKHGMMSGHWTLEHGGKTLASARKPSAMFRSFEVSCADTHLTVKASSAFTRCFDILSKGRVIGSIQPGHLFTRRATIACNAEVPEIAQLFSFWLVVLTWRRAAHKSSS